MIRKWEVLTQNARGTWRGKGGMFGRAPKVTQSSVELIKALTQVMRAMLTPYLEAVVRQRAVGMQEKTAFQAKGTTLSKGLEAKPL